MTPLGEYTWRLISDSSLSEIQRMDASWNLWRDAGVNAVAYAGAFAGLSMNAAVAAVRATATQDGELSAPPVSDAATAVFAQAGSPDVPRHAWNYLTKYQTASEMDVLDPDLDKMFDALVEAYEGIAGYAFAYWGGVALTTAVVTNPEGGWFQQVKQQAETVDLHLQSGGSGSS